MFINIYTLTKNVYSANPKNHNYIVYMYIYSSETNLAHTNLGRTLHCYGKWRNVCAARLPPVGQPAGTEWPVPSATKTAIFLSTPGFEYATYKVCLSMYNRNKKLYKHAIILMVDKALEQEPAGMMAMVVSGTDRAQL